MVRLSHLWIKNFDLMPAHTSVLISMKHQYLGVLLRPPGPDANPLQGYPPTVCRQYLVIQLAEERQSGVKFLV